MAHYECKPCEFNTTKKSHYNQHLLTNKHKINVNPLFECDKCKYKTIKKSDYERHLLSKKHINNISIQNNKNNDKVENINDQKIEELKKEIEKLRELNEKNTQTLKDTNNQNTQKIVKEARKIKSSMLTMLNTYFKDTPSIEYIQQEPFFTELEEEYKAKINDGTDKLFIRIFSDYNKKKLVKTLSDLILKFVKKDNQKFQSVFNIDCARGNFATKIDDFWMNDKKGLRLRKFTVDKVINFMIDVLDVFRLQLVKKRNENLIKSTTERSDYLMENQTLLLEVVSFLTNSNTHTKIVMHLSPNLRCEDKLISLYLT